MTSKAFELARLGNAYSDGALSNRNLIINGAMQVAQRGVSFTPSNGAYTLDRWRCAFNNSAPIVTQETGSTFGTKRTHLKFISGASSTYAYVAQRIEDIAQFDGKTVTVSFDYKSDNDFSYSFEYHFGSGGSSSLYDKHENTITASSSVKRTSVTVTLDDISGKTIGAANTSHLDLLFNMTANNKTFEITNVQLEVGDTATPFEHRSYGDELARCQRYYQYINTGTLGFGNAYAANSWNYKGIPQFVELRATPTITYDNGTGGNWQSSSAAYGVTAKTSSYSHVYAKSDGAYTDIYIGGSGIQFHLDAEL